MQAHMTQIRLLKGDPMRIKTAIAALATTMLLPALAQAQSEYPTRPITLIVPFPAGGVTDVAGRVVAENLSKHLGQSVVVVNRPGATGNIGTAQLARAKPDGYTLGILTVSAMSIAPHIFKKLDFNAETSFTPISNVIRTDGAIVANKAAPFNTVQEMVAYAKKNPGKVTYATTGIGSSQHVTAEMFSQVTGAQLLHVPYTGSSPAFQDLLANHIDLSFETALVSAVNNLSTGKLKIVAITGPKRSSAAPEVPTVAESGYPEFSAQGWFGLFGPAGLPDGMVTQLNEALQKTLVNPEVIERFKTLGVIPDPQTPDAFNAFLKAENAKWGTVAKSLNLELN